MRNYIDPEMNIAMFEAESVVVTNSTKSQARDFFSRKESGATGGSEFTAATVDASNILDFTTTN